MPRTDPDTLGPEPAVLAQFLDYHRATLVMKASGLDRAQLSQTTAASDLTLGGLVKHLALVEDSWFGSVMLGRPLPEPWVGVDWQADPDWDLHSAVDDEPHELIALYKAACERSRAAVAELNDLDAVSRGEHRSGERFNLRWVILHMIEETARHNGHADLLREAIDGATGE